MPEFFRRQMTSANQKAQRRVAQLAAELMEANAIIAEHQRGDKMLCELLGSETIAEGIEKLKRATAQPNSEVRDEHRK